MTPDQRNIVRRVYNHLLSHENRGWDELDDFVDYLGFLDDNELHRECDILYSQHKNVAVKCQQKHSKEECFIPILVEAVFAIIELYKETNHLPIKNKYVLQYYLAMNQANMIVIDGQLVKP